MSKRQKRPDTTEVVVDLHTPESVATDMQTDETTIEDKPDSTATTPEPESAETAQEQVPSDVAQEVGLVATEEEVLAPIEPPVDAPQPATKPAQVISAPLGAGDPGAEKSDEIVSANDTRVRRGIYGRKTIILLVVAIIAILAVGVFLALVAARTISPVFSVGGVPYTHAQDEKLLANQLSAHVAKQAITISGNPDVPNGTRFLYGDAGVTVDAATSAKRALAAREGTAYIRRLMWWRQVNEPLVNTVDTTKLDAFIAAKAVKVTKEPVNAVLAVDNAVVSVTAGKDGEQLAAADAAGAIRRAVASGQSIQLTLTKRVRTPAITTSAAESAENQAEKALKQSVVFAIGSDTFTPTPTIVGSWVESLDAGAKNPTLTFSKDRILAYIDRIAEGYVTPPRNEVAITSSDGVKHVYAAGRNGTDIANKQDIAQAIATDLAAAKAINQTLAIGDKPYETVIPSYSKWILVNLTTKRLVAYEGNNPVNEIKVSAGAPETPTVTGVYSIYAKYRSQTMTGYNADGTKYTQPNVEWINYFYRDYALHGNYWRPVSWFGEKNGSHGCVGMLNDDAQWVYDWAPIGTTVIVY